MLSPTYNTELPTTDKPHWELGINCREEANFIHIGLVGELAGGIAVTAGISLTKEDSSAVHSCERGGGLLSLVNLNLIKSAHPPLSFDTLVTGMVGGGRGGGGGATSG